MVILTCGATRCVFANFSALDLKQNHVKWLGRVGKRFREVLRFHIEEGMGDVMEVCDIDDKAADNQNRPVIRLRWIVE